MTGLRLNIGCGATPTAGWANFDNSWTIRAARNPLLKTVFEAGGLLRGKESYLDAIHRHDIRWANATAKIPVADASAEVVYTSHMVEHLTRDEVDSFLAEARRVLARGGILRIAVPDIDYHVGQYHEHGDADRFFDGLCVTGEAPRGLTDKVKNALVGERHHQWMYNGRTMSAMLERAGFVDVTVRPAGTTGIADPGALDLHERAPESVFVEAVKP